MNAQVQTRQAGVFQLAVIVAALGYFVDIYDLLLFTVVKQASLFGLGSTDATLLADSTRVINWQMVGLLLGGIIWGVLGAVSYTHLRAHETGRNLVCRL